MPGLTTATPLSLPDPSLHTHSQPLEFQRVLVPLFKQLSRCLTSAHFQVAERSLFLWNHEYIITLVAQYRQVRGLSFVLSCVTQGHGSKRLATQQVTPSGAHLCSARSLADTLRPSQPTHTHTLSPCCPSCLVHSRRMLPTTGTPLCTASPATCARCSW
jgi:hypothetical protein